MHQSNGLIFSRDVDTIAVFSQICRTIRVNLEHSQDIKTFLLKVMQNSLGFIIFDCDSLKSDAPGWVTLIRHMRPKIPLVVLCDDVDREVGGRMLEEGVFYLALRPFQRNTFAQILQAALKQAK